MAKAAYGITCTLSRVMLFVEVINNLFLFTMHTVHVLKGKQVEEMEWMEISDTDK